jgi:signal transduction histidine kinase
MIREETEVAERFGPRVDANFGERLRFGYRLKSEVLDYWSRRIRLWSKKITLLQQFVISTVVVLGLTMVAVGTWMSAHLEDGALRSGAGAAALYMSSFIEPHIQSIDDGGMLSSDDLANLYKISSDLSLRRHVKSIKIWRPDGTILFSNRQTLIGRKFSSVAIQPSLDGDIRVAMANLNEDDSEFERTLAIPLYEIFAPLYRNGTGKIIAVAEFYRDADELLDNTTTVRNSWLIVGVSSLGMFLALFAIVYRGSAKIEQQRSLLKRRFREQANLRRANSELERRMRDALTETARIDDLIQRRLGAELHDGPAQLVAFVLLRLDEIGTVSGETLTSAGVIEDLRRVASDALKNIRMISNDLFLPSADGTNDLVEVLKAVTRNHERRTNSTVALSVLNIPERISTEIIRCVGRVVQEALNNCFKHAGAVNQAVSVAGVDHSLVISIRDGGPGMAEQNALTTEKLGLRGMKYRVEAVGGVFEVKSRQGNGTEVRCKIPLTLAVS